MFSDPDWLRSLDSASSALLRRSLGFDLHDVRTVQLTFVLKQRDKLSPRRIVLVPSVFIVLKHSFDIKVLNEYGVVLRDKPRRYLVQHLPADMTLDRGDVPTLLLVVI